jgi:dynein heavy chain
MDLPLFDGIIKDLFPTLSQPEIDYGSLDRAIRAAIRSFGLQVTMMPASSRLVPSRPIPSHRPPRPQEHPFFIAKVIELYSMTLVRHGMMLVGPTGGGKTMNYKVRAARPPPPPGW